MNEAAIIMITAVSGLNQVTAWPVSGLARLVFYQEAFGFIVLVWCFGLKYEARTNIQLFHLR